MLFRNLLIAEKRVLFSQSNFVLELTLPFLPFHERIKLSGVCSEWYQEIGSSNTSWSDVRIDLDEVNLWEVLGRRGRRKPVLRENLTCCPVCWFRNVSHIKTLALSSANNNKGLNAFRSLLERSACVRDLEEVYILQNPFGLQQYCKTLLNVARSLDEPQSTPVTYFCPKHMGSRCFSVDHMSCYQTVPLIPITPKESILWLKRLCIGVPLPNSLLKLLEGRLPFLQELVLTSVCEDIVGLLDHLGGVLFSSCCEKIAAPRNQLRVLCIVAGCQQVAEMKDENNTNACLTCSGCSSPALVPVELQTGPVCRGHDNHCSWKREVGLTGDPFREDGDEFVEELILRHGESIVAYYCPDIPLSYEVFQQLGRLRNLKMLYVPGWSALDSIAGS
eukprot:GHVQ01033304.1.p1 GENE.GHVQ01033304.1~~GHVQ01033304.1.p1  ORF type:complete len:390 (+),score=28.08 GHVQ01033304.1:126-1295(+)